MIADEFDTPKQFTRDDGTIDDEMDLVFDSWSRSFRKSPWAGCVPNHLWDSTARASIGELVDRSLVIVAVINLPNGKRRVMGYSVSEPGVLHWLYVKDDYRGFGVGRALRDLTTRDWQQFVYTHRTRASAKFLGQRFHWDPVLARVRK